MACGEQDAPSAAPARELWARVSGVLPVTATSLYRKPYIGNPQSFDIRYVSISSVNRSPPGVVFRTVSDTEILEFNRKKRKRGSHGEIERSYSIWFGPDEQEMPEAAKAEGAMFLPWPREVHESDGDVAFGDLVPFPGVLYREVLSQSQVLPPSSVDFDQGVTDIVGEVCSKDVQGFGNNSSIYCRHELCCGDSPPECCRSRKHIHAAMGEHMPKIEYFRYKAGEDGEAVAAM